MRSIQLPELDHPWCRIQHQRTTFDRDRDSTGWRGEHQRLQRRHRNLYSPGRHAGVSRYDERYEAQFGRASGGIVNVTTKAGSNAFHGDAWEFNRISALTSNTETNDQEGNPKGVYTRNQFGAAVGGPVMKNKLFFFGTGEWIRVRSSAVVTAGIPTSQFLALAAPNIQSYFQLPMALALRLPLRRPIRHQRCMVRHFRPHFRRATPMFGIVTYTAPTNAGGGVPQNTYNFVGRGDYNLSDKSQMFFRYIDYKEVDQTGGGFASPYKQYDVGSTEDDQAYLYNFSHDFSRAFVTNDQAQLQSLQHIRLLQHCVTECPDGGCSGECDHPDDRHIDSIAGLL